MGINSVMDPLYEADPGLKNSKIGTRNKIF